MQYLRSSFAIGLLALAAFVFAAPAPVSAQDDTSVAKSTATLAAPDGATNTSAKGKAKTFSRESANNPMEKLSVTAQQLTRRTDYRVVINGVELGVFSPKGNSGTLNLRYRTPAKGHQAGIPAALGSVRNFQTIDIYNAGTGELVLTGTFVVDTEDD
jgi:hypothetical protein